MPPQANGADPGSMLTQRRAEALCDGGGSSADQPATAREAVSSVAPSTAPVPRATVGNCRYCAVHRVTLAASPSHRAACRYFHRCPCFACRKLHLKNHLDAETMPRGCAAAAAVRAAAKRTSAGSSSLLELDSGAF